ncbi:ROK family protein [Streptomyces sp. YIM 130001]|uniref:ROK family protein n=1 Tax=Streptomyces sp. YIM 130001 TaxID=2259644 RepID=UPI0013C44444|nr:ROK family protein [Streptomyces sp. YIM 130001]
MRLVPEPESGPPAPRPALGAVEVLPGLVRAALVSRAGELLHRTETAFDAAGPRSCVDEALRAAAEACFRGEGRRPAGVGVAAAGLVDPATGTVLEVNDVPALHGYPVAAVLSALVAAPVHVEHRARLQVLGDRWFGAGRGRRTFASVATGEVLGVGLLYDGAVLAPDGGRSGAHMTVAASGERCTCGARGCWKTMATTRWLRRRAQEAGLTGVTSLADLADRDDATARTVVEEYADNLALGLVNVQQLFAPGLFVLHGEAREGGEPFRARIEERLRRDTAWSTAEPPRALLGDVGPDDVALLGGAGLVLTHA